MDKNTHIVRKIQLSKLGSYQIKDNEKTLFEFVENNLLNLKSIKSIKNIDCIHYFNNKKENILTYNSKNKILEINFLLVWKYLIIGSNNVIEAKEFIKNIIKQVYKMDITKVVLVEANRFVGIYGY